MPPRPRRQRERAGGSATNARQPQAEMAQGGGGVRPLAGQFGGVQNAMERQRERSARGGGNFNFFGGAGRPGGWLSNMGRAFTQQLGPKPLPPAPAGPQPTAMGMRGDGVAPTPNYPVNNPAASAGGLTRGINPRADLWGGVGPGPQGAAPAPAPAPGWGGGAPPAPPPAAPNMAAPPNGRERRLNSRFTQPPAAAAPAGGGFMPGGNMAAPPQVQNPAMRFAGYQQRPQPNLAGMTAAGRGWGGMVGG